MHWFYKRRVCVQPARPTWGEAGMVARAAGGCSSRRANCSLSQRSPQGRAFLCCDA